MAYHRIQTRKTRTGILEIHQIPVLQDNYVYLIHEPVANATAVVDPAVAPPVVAALAEKGWSLTHVFNTHHHWDHVGGNLELKARTGCTVVGFKADRARIPGLDVAVGEGDSVSLGEAVARVIEVPGHTLGHIAYWFFQENALFCGDTLFAMGCGRLFEGSAEQMWRSLAKLRALPPETQIYCAHEYTHSNGRFALSLEPDSPTLLERMQEVNRLRRQGMPTVPSTLQEELTTNPFLRADDPLLQQAVGLEGADPVRVFAELRRRKDRF